MGRNNDDNEINALVDKLTNMNMWSFVVGVICGMGIMIAIILFAKALGWLVW